MLALVTIFGTHLSDEDFGVFLLGGITTFGITAACLIAKGKENYVYGILFVGLLVFCLAALRG